MPAILISNYFIGSIGKNLCLICARAGGHYRHTIMRTQEQLNGKEKGGTDDAVLRESEARFRSLFMNAPIAIYVHDKDTFAMVDANPCACASFGYATVEELKAADLWLEAPYSFEDAKRWMRKTVEEGGQLYEWCSRDSGGKLFWEQLQLVKIPLGGKERLLVMATNITERKRAEDALRASEEKFRSVADNIPGVVYLCRNDERWTMMYLNDRVEELTGYPKEAFLGDAVSFMDLYHPEDKASVDREVTRALAENARYHLQYRLRHRSGQWRWIEEYGAALGPAGQADLLEGVMVDITARKEVEAQVEALNGRMRDVARQEAHQTGKIETATGILHDVGNAISGMGAVFVEFREGDSWPEIDRLRRVLAMVREREAAFEAVLGEGKGTALGDYLDMLTEMLADRAARQRAATDRAEAIVGHISSILTIQREYALGGASGDRAPVRLGTLLDDALNMMGASIAKRGIRVDRRYGTDDGPVSGDRTGLVQVFMNILKNACEAFDQGPQPKECTLVLSIGKGPSGGGWRVEVVDNACGFSADVIPQLFQPAYTTKSRGTGVGLPFVRSVMEAHGGYAELTSPGPGLGARAVLDFPACGG